MGTLEYLYSIGATKKGVTVNKKSEQGKDTPRDEARDDAGPTLRIKLCEGRSIMKYKYAHMQIYNNLSSKTSSKTYERYDECLIFLFYASLLRTCSLSPYLKIISVPTFL